MAKAFLLATLLALAGCAAAPAGYALTPDPCTAAGEASMDCQVFRYRNMP